MKRVLTVAGLLVISTAALAYAGSAGQLDGSFGRNGAVVLRDVPGQVNAVAVGGHNRIVVVGKAGNGSFTIARLLSRAGHSRGGQVDTHFGDDGVVTVPFAAGPAEATSVAIGREGGIVVAGTVCSDSVTCRFGVARLKPNGDLDRDFGDDGTVDISFPKPYGRDPSVALGSRGRIVVAGGACAGSHTRRCDIALAALEGDGSLDPRFGGDGEVVSSFAHGSDRCQRAFESGAVEGMALDSHDRILVDGQCMQRHRAAVARYRQDGERDRSFGASGIVDRDLGIWRVHALTIDQHDRIDVVGERGTSYAVARLRTGGKPDRSFGRDGTASIKFARHQGDFARKHHAVAHSAAVDSRGRIVVGGSHAGAFAFARFKRSGHADRRFGRRGRVLVRDPRRDYRWTGTVAVDAKDRIIGSGAARLFSKSPHRHFALVRLLG